MKYLQVEQEFINSVKKQIAELLPEITTEDYITIKHDGIHLERQKNILLALLTKLDSDYKNYNFLLLGNMYFGWKIWIRVNYSDLSGLEF